MEAVETRYHPDEPPVLNRFDLRVRHGETVSLLGPSGVGKTTALRVIAGFERVASGYVRIDGRLVGSPFIHVPPDERGLGLVFQSYALFPHLSVAANVAFGMRGMSAVAKRARANEIMEICGIAEYGDRAVHDLSGGQQQRVAIARAIAPDSIAVLMDEPFSNLDAGLVNQLRVQVRKIIRDAEKTALLVTHDRETAFLASDRIAVMRAGMVEQIGAPETVYARPVSMHVARAVGSSAFLPGTWRSSRVFTEAGDFPAVPANGEKLRDGSDVLALMRASELRLRRHGTSGDEEDGYFRMAAPCSADCRCAARIAAREFHGDFTNFEVRLPSGAMFHVRSRRYASEQPDGAPVTVETIRGARVIVYPTDAG